MPDHYGVFVMTICPVCGRIRSQPMYKDEQLVLEVCDHKPSVTPVPQELVLQRLPVPEDHILNVSWRKI